jgi:hypothetical protein
MKQSINEHLTASYSIMLIINVPRNIILSGSKPPFKILFPQLDNFKPQSKRSQINQPFFTSHDEPFQCFLNNTIENSPKIDSTIQPLPKKFKNHLEFHLKNYIFAPQNLQEKSRAMIEKTIRMITIY